MIIDQKQFNVGGVSYAVRSAQPNDADSLSRIRVQIDGETQNMDREPGEAFLDTPAFRKIIMRDTEDDKNLFLVASVNDQIVGFARCEGNHLKRFAHKIEFGVCVLKKYWGLRIGTNLLRESIAWAESNQIKKMALYVTETNQKAIRLYKTHGFHIEGVLKSDKLLSDGRLCNTVVMGRICRYD